MNDIKTNIDDPYDLFAAIKKKGGGKKGVTVCAEECGEDQPIISMHIHKRRKTKRVRQKIANWLGCGVYGVMPEKEEGEQ